MSLIPVQVQPGIYTETTARAALNRFKDGSNVRFFKMNPEKVGGCVKQIAATMAGVCRSITSWTTTNFERLIAFGTNSKLYLTDSAAYFDITPIRRTVNVMVNNSFSTMNLSKTVTVNDVGNGASVGDHVTFANVVPFAGINPNGDQIITVIVDADNYQFDAANAANATMAGGGNVATAAYDITSGNVNSVVGGGWGAGGWGVGTWGTPRISGTLQLARIWSMPNWGDDLIASPIGGPMYIWLNSGGTNTRAVLIPQAPMNNRFVLVSDQLRVAISFGSNDGVNADPMLIRWCDSEDYTDWTPSPTNLAGDKRLDHGSVIITAIQTKDEIVIYTDTTIYSMTLTGDNLVFAFASKGDTVGLCGPKAAVDVNGTTYAMGRGQFYSYDGQIKILPSDIHSRIFGTPEAPALNFQQAQKVFLARNKLKSEIIGFFPSPGSIEIDSCFGYNYDDGNWWIGDLAKTAWLDENAFFDVPVATSVPDGTVTSQLFLQEVGVDNDTEALPYFLETYDIEVSGSNNVITGAVTGAGEYLEKVTRIFPDFVRLIGKHMVTLKGKKYPTDKKYMVRGPKPVVQGQRRVDMHMRARQMAIRIESKELGADIEIGAWRLDNRVQGQN